MMESERQQILEDLKTGSGALHDALNGVDESLATRQPAPGSWSILECVEHLAVAEQFLYSRLTQATPSETPLVNSAREAMIATRAADRSRPLPSPDVGLPHGRYGSLREAIAAFDSARAATVRFVEEFPGDLRASITDHPMIPGPVNCREILLLICAHPLRHAKQIAEIRAALSL